MRLRAVEISGFGKWQQKKIDFLPNNQLFYGVNEAGKSTLYHFIQAMLFGFPTKGKRRKDYQPRNGASYGGRLWFIHPVYGEVQIERFKSKNRGQAVVYFDQKIGDEATLKTMLHPLTKELFQTVFTIQQEQLSQLDKLTEDELQTALLSLGVSGSHQLLVSRENHIKKAQAIYKGKGSQPPLNKKLIEYQNIQKQLHEKEQQEQGFQTLTNEGIETERKIKEKIDLLETNRKTLELLNKKVMHLPFLEELRSIQQQQKPVLKPTQQEQEELLAAYQHYRYLNEKLVQLNQEVANESRQINETENYEFYLANEPLIQQLVEQKYKIDACISDVKWTTETLRENERELDQLSRKWQWLKERPPQVPLDEQETETLQNKVQLGMLRVQKIHTTIQVLEEDIQVREENLNTFEQMNKRLFEKEKPATTKQINYLFLLIGIGVLVLGGFLPVPFRYAGIVFGFVGILVGFLPMRDQRKQTAENEKEQWQEKLAQLDHATNQLLEAKQELISVKHEQHQLIQSIKKIVEEKHLGTMDRVEYWLTHRVDITRYISLIAANKKLEQQIINQQMHLSDISQQTEPLTKVLPIATASVGKKIQVIADFAERMEQVRFIQENQADAYLRQSMREVKEKQKELIDATTPLLYRFAIDSINQIPEKLAMYQKEMTTQQRKAELEQLLTGIYQESDQPDQLRERQSSLEASIQLIEAEVSQLNRQEQSIGFKIQQMTADGTLDELYQQKEEIKTQIDELAHEWTSELLAGQLLIDLLTELSEQQLPSLLKKASEYLQKITENSYTSLSLFEEQLLVSRSDNQRFFLHELSTGTCDQVVMVMRFAFLSLQAQRHLCPILIDDGWLHYDSQRKQQLAKLLYYFSKKEQVICFSSDKEMVSYYQELNQPIIELEGVSYG